jgi:urease accessory protein
MTGSIALACAERDGRSYLSRIRYDGLGPGVIGGDRYALDVHVEANASLLVAGQMATPVYAHSATSSLDATWHVASGASLVVCGEPVMLDAGARHDIRTTLDVDGSGCAILADIVTVAPAALARVRTIARIDGRVVARDSCDLAALSGCLATIVVACADAARRARLAVALETVIAVSPPGVRAGVGATDGAVVVRAAGDQIWYVQRFVGLLIAAARDARSDAVGCSSSLDAAWLREFGYGVQRDREPRAGFPAV